MAHTWVDGEVITAEKLNDDTNLFKINVISWTSQGTGYGTVQLDCTFEQVLNAYNNGKIIIVESKRQRGPNSGYIIVFHLYQIMLEYPEENVYAFELCSRADDDTAYSPVRIEITAEENKYFGDI